MGFSKSKVQETVDIAFTLEVEDEHGRLDSATVIHHFNRPTMKIRERYRQIASKIHRGRVKLNVTAANSFLWDTCIISVDGYDDLSKENDWKAYFNKDEIGKEHKDIAAKILTDRISEQEEELEGNSDG